MQTIKFGNSGPQTKNGRQQGHSEVRRRQEAAKAFSKNDEVEVKFRGKDCGGTVVRITERGLLRIRFNRNYVQSFDPSCVTLISGAKSNA